MIYNLYIFSEFIVYRHTQDKYGTFKQIKCENLISDVVFIVSFKDLY